jgi:hypothetical protein
MKIFIGLLFAGLSLAQTRVVGPEPGLGFGNVPSNLCSYGEYQRVPTSAFGGSCSTTFFKMDDVFATRYSAGLPMSIPSTQAATYAVKVVVNGVTYPGTIPGFSSTGLNVGDPNFQKYYFLDYVPNYLIPNGPYPTNTTTTHPLYISLDAQGTDYAAWGANVNGVWTKGKWVSTQAQNGTDWLNAYRSFYTYAKNNQPRVRVSPHLSSMNDPSASTFKLMFADVPALEKEGFKISSLATAGGYSRGQLYYQILNVYWFANVAPPVFANDPPTRVTQWGTWLDNGDIHTALAFYSMTRGPNSFFDLLSPTNNPIDPTQWLGIVKQLGSSTSAPTVVSTASGKIATSGYNLWKRTWQHGISYFNHTGAAVTVTLPTGAKNWSGVLVKTITLADGKGDVFVIPPTISAGANINGATALISAQ